MEFLRMIKDAENQKIDLIITKSISRFARNTTDCIEAVRLLKGLGVGVFFEKENINTLSAESELVLTILSSIAEEELASMSQNIRWSNQKRFKQGKLQLVTERFMGYDRDGKGGLVINGEQAVIVRRIFNECISGLGVTKIARGLEADGINNVSRGINWQPSVILGMLKNEKYMGDVILQKTVTANNITFKRKPNEGEAPMYYVKDNHPPIIEREKFDLVQELLKERSRRRGYSSEMAWKYQNRYPFSQKIVCGNCGRILRHQVHNSSNPSRQYFWACATYIERKIAVCDMRPIKNDTLERLFVRVFNKLFMNRNILTSFSATLRLVNDVKIGGGQLKEINADIDDLLKQEHVLLELYEKGVTDKAILRIEHEELIGNIGRLRAERNTVVQQIESQDDRLKRTDELITMFARVTSPMETFDKKLFETIVEKLVVKERECIVFCLKNGMELEEHYKLLRGSDKV